jgi:hypothetical protein
MAVKKQILALVLALSFACAVAHTQERAVTKAEVFAKPNVYNGACPADIKFIATISVSRRPLTVTYQWERSDGVKSAPEKVEVTSHSRSINVTWKVGSPGSKTTVWEKLHVVSPTGMSSEKGEATLNCR